MRQNRQEFPADGKSGRKRVENAKSFLLLRQGVPAYSSRRLHKNIKSFLKFLFSFLKKLSIFSKKLLKSEMTHIYMGLRSLTLHPLHQPV